MLRLDVQEEDECFFVVCTCLGRWRMWIADGQTQRSKPQGGGRGISKERPQGEASKIRKVRSKKKGRRTELGLRLDALIDGYLLEEGSVDLGAQRGSKR